MSKTRAGQRTLGSQKGRDRSSRPRPGRATEETGGPFEGFPPLWRDWAFIAIVLIASFLLLANLSSGALWQDEAETAVVAKTIMHYGVPRGFDGFNYFSQNMGRECGPNYIWKLHPWVQFYVLVPFLAVLGNTTAAARLPFALLGIGCVILTYILACRMWRNRLAGIFAALTLTFSVPFLIMARQCRYYSPAAFFTLLALLGYMNIVERRKHAWLLFVVAATLLFQSQMLIGAALLCAVGIHMLIFSRDRWKPAIISLAIISVINLPIALWFAKTAQNSLQPLTSDAIVGRLHDYSLQILDYVMPSFAIVIVAAIIEGVISAVPVEWRRAIRSIRAKLQQSDGRTTGWVVLFVIFAAVSMVILAGLTPTAYFRYLTPLVPLGAMILGLVLGRWHPAVGAILLACLVFWSPIKAMTGDTGDKNDISTYLYEITHQYTGPIDGLVGYLNSHAKKGDVVLVTYGDQPIKYYTRLRVIGGLTGEITQPGFDLRPALGADWIIVRRHLGSPYEIPAWQVIWMIAHRNLSPNEMPQPQQLIGELQQATEIPGYRRIELDIADVAYQNREDPEEHRSRSAQIDDENPKVTIYQRIPEGSTK